MIDFTSVTSDELLNNIFSITENLYKEMCKGDDDVSDDHANIFRLLMDLGRTLVNSDRASFWKWDKRRHELWTTAAVGTGIITIPEGTDMVGKALAIRKAIITKSILVMPNSNCKGEFIGAYQAINKTTKTTP